MVFKPLKNEIRSWSTGFLLVLSILPLCAHAATTAELIAERNHKLAEVSERFDREMDQKQSLYKRQMVSALKELRAILVRNELRLRTMNPQLTPRALAGEFSNVADFIFASYGVSPGGPFMNDMPTAWNEVEASGVLESLPVSTSPSKGLQQALRRQQALLINGQNAVLAYLSMSTASVKRSTIEDAVMEIEKDPNGDIFVLMYEKLDAAIRRLDSAPTSAPRSYRRGHPTSIG